MEHGRDEGDDRVFGCCRAVDVTLRGESGARMRVLCHYPSSSSPVRSVFRNGRAARARNETATGGEDDDDGARSRRR